MSARSISATNQSPDKPLKRSNILGLLGSAPVIGGENIHDYSALYERLVSAVDPTDTIEEIWIKDIADLIWELQRLRRFKAQMLRSLEYVGVDELLKAIATPSVRANMVDVWRGGDAADVQQIRQFIHNCGFSDETITAHVLAANIALFENLDRMIARVENRREKILREIDRRRTAFAISVRKASNEIPDGEFKEVAPEPLATL